MLYSLVKKLCKKNQKIIKSRPDENTCRLTILILFYGNIPEKKKQSQEGITSYRFNLKLDEPFYRFLKYLVKFIWIARHFTDF